MISPLKVAKMAADNVLGLKNYKKFQAVGMKANKKLSEASKEAEELLAQLRQLSGIFISDRTSKGSAVADSLKLMREALSLLEQAKEKMHSAQDRMRQVDWEKL